MLDLVGQPELAARLEHALGGRVAPMMLNGPAADPFVLLVHHRHRFHPLDVVRPIFNLVLPEGFPAHPHRGAETVTMTLRGGLAHRGSIGVARLAGRRVQWLTAARGMLHEEMWAPAERATPALPAVAQPARRSNEPPRVRVLGRPAPASRPRSRPRDSAPARRRGPRRRRPRAAAAAHREPGPPPARSP